MTQIVSELPEGVIAQSHEVSTYIEILSAGKSTGEVLTEAVQGSVTMQSGADARARCSLDVVGIDDLIPVSTSSVLNVYQTELAIYRGLMHEGDTYLVPLGVFGIDQSQVSDTGGEVTIAINGRDRAGRFISPEGGFEGAGFLPAETKAGAAIISVLLANWPDMPYDVNAFDGLTVPLPALTWEEGEDRWAFCSGIASSCGGELFFDRLGRLTVQPVPDLSTAEPIASIYDGEGGTLMNISRDWDRSRVINRWTVIGQNASNDPSEVVPRGVALDNDPSSPTYYYGTFGKRLETVNNSFVASNTQAQDMATGLLAKSIGTPDSISFGAIPDPGRSPLDVVTVERSRLGIASNQIIDTITHPLGAGEVMTADTRITQALS